MVKIPEEAKPVFEKQRVLPFATATSDGVPNSVFVAFWWFEGDDTVVVIDNFLGKTRRNLEANPWGTVTAFDMEKHKAYQLKGRAVIQTEGPRVERGKAMAKKFKEDRNMEMPAKAAVVLTVEEVYFLAPGPDAGKRLA